MDTQTPPPPSPPAPGWIAPLLSGVAGFVDTTGFVAFAGVFVAHVTGNFVVLGATISGQSHGSVAAKLAVLPLFVVGVVLGVFIARASPTRAPRRIALAQTAFLILCGLLGVVLHTGHAAPAAAIIEWLAIACGVLAMGLQAMLARSLKLPMTHVMTGNVTQLTVDLLELPAHRPGTGSSVRKNLALVVAFALGAAAAGLLVPSFGAGAVLLPAAACALIALALPA